MKSVNPWVTKALGLLIDDKLSNEEHAKNESGIVSQGFGL